MSAPFLGMSSAPWNPSLPIQPGLGVNQIPTYQPTQTMLQFPTCQPIPITQPAQLTLQTSQLV